MCMWWYVLADDSQPDKPGYTKYTALYQFDARNADELTVTPGDIIWVSIGYFHIVLHLR